VKHFYELRDAGIRCWEWKRPRELRNETPDPPKSAAPERRGSNLNGLAPNMATSVFSEGWEQSTIPGSLWSADDYNQDSGLDYWRDVSTSCGSAHGGSWMASASGTGDIGCAAYDNDMTADLQYTSSVNMSGYAAFVVSFWAKYNTENGYDVLSFQAGGSPNPTTPLVSLTGSSGGWAQQQVTFNNQSGTYNSLYLRFVFVSDDIVTQTGGVFVDDVSVDPIYPNLAATTPSGWSGPIVPSMVTGTTTTGSQLYTGQTSYIDWAVRNTGQATAGGFWIDYYLDNSVIGSDFVSSLAPSTNYSRTDWGTTIWTAGSHTLKMVIDPTSSVSESNEGDNTYQATFTWSNPPAPDLVVTSMTLGMIAAAPAARASPVSGPDSPTFTAIMGQTVDISVTVKNQGSLGAGASQVGWYPNGPGQPGGQVLGVLALGVNASQTVHFFTTGVRAETWNMIAVADVGGAVNEGAAEGNNAYGPVQLTWSPRQIWVTGAFAYDDSFLGTTTTPCNDVQVIDTNDPNGDDVLGAAAVCCFDTKKFLIGPITGEDVDNDHGFPDLFVRVNYRSNEACWNAAYPNNQALTLIKADGTPWRFDSSVHSDFAGDTLDVGLLKPTDYGNRWALHLWRVILRGWAYVRNNWVSPPDPVHSVFVQWEPGYAPISGTAHVSPDTIKISGAILPSGLGPDEWDDQIVLHEYGHHTSFWGGFDTDVFPGDDGQPHYIDAMAPSLNTAWSEGWAHYFAATVTPSTEARLVDTGRTTGGLWRRVDTLLEGDSVVFYKALPQPNWTSADIDTVVHLNENGAQWEASVAGTLWDICDARNDNPNGDACADSLSDGFNTLYNALHTGSPPGTDRVTDVLTARTFYDSLAAHPATNIVKFGLSQRVFCEHGIQGGPTLTAVDGAGSPDARLRIVKVFPNPFNPRIHIVIQVPAQRVRTRTTLRVYDIQGRRVRTLLDGRPPAGVGEVVWDGRSDVGVEAASGVYLCRLESGRSVQAAKVILLR
jgi:hypothetical protein